MPCRHSLIYDNDLDQLLILAFMTNSLLHSQLKHLLFLSLLIRLSVYQTQASSLGVLITFQNAFHFNLVVLFVCFTFVSSVINSIYLKQDIIIIVILNSRTNTLAYLSTAPEKKFLWHWYQQFFFFLQKVQIKQWLLLPPFVSKLHFIKQLE